MTFSLLSLNMSKKDVLLVLPDEYKYILIETEVDIIQSEVDIIHFFFT